MNRIKKYPILLFFILGFAFSKNTYTISGSVKNEAGDIIKKGSVILVNKQDGSEIKKTKINRKGEFKLKKIQTGKYQINVDADGKVTGHGGYTTCLLYTSPSPRDRG